MNKKPQSGLLSALAVYRAIPRRFHNLYYSVLERTAYPTLDFDRAIIADGIATCYCEYAEARESLSDPDKRRDAPELESIEKRLRGWLSAWRESSKGQADNGDLARELDQLTERDGKGYIN